MKRYLLFILCIMCWAGINAQSYFFVEAGGDVQYQKTSSPQWHAFSQGSTLVLTGTDSICINNGGYVKIDDGNTSYYFTSACKSTPNVMVRHKKTEQAKNFSTNGLNKEINSDTTEPLSMKQVGAGKVRSLDSNPYDYDLLSDQLKWVATLVYSGANSLEVDGLTLIKRKLDDGQIDFELKNKTYTDYYINVLHINKRTHRISLCYVIPREVKHSACLMTPSGYCTYNMGIHFPDTQDDVYVLIAFKDPYDSDKLDSKLGLFDTVPHISQTDIPFLYKW